MKVLRVLVPAVLKFVTLTALLFSTPLRAGVVLPDSGGFLVDDFLIFSLAEINFRAGEGISPHPGDPFHVASAPGQIKDEIILATGSNNGPLNDNPAGIDDAYRTPTGDTDTTFNTITIEDGGAADPGGVGEFTGDSENTWDILVATLKDFLNAGGGEFVVYFNMNEIGEDTLGGKDLLIYAEFTLSGSPTLDDITFFLRDDENPGSNPDQWVTTFGTICATMTAFLHTGPCTDDEVNMQGAATISQNLGADNAAFAAFSEDLNDLIFNADYVTLSVSSRFASLNNGYEQAFILADTTVTRINEPYPVGLFLFGLIALLVHFKTSRVKPWLLK